MWWYCCLWCSIVIQVHRWATTHRPWTVSRVLRHKAALEESNRLSRCCGKLQQLLLCLLQKLQFDYPHCVLQVGRANNDKVGDYSPSCANRGCCRKLYKKFVLEDVSCILAQSFFWCKSFPLKWMELCSGRETCMHEIVVVSFDGLISGSIFGWHLLYYQYHLPNFPVQDSWACITLQDDLFCSMSVSMSKVNLYSALS